MCVQRARSQGSFAIFNGNFFKRKLLALAFSIHFALLFRTLVPELRCLNLPFFLFCICTRNVYHVHVIQTNAMANSLSLHEIEPTPSPADYSVTTTLKTMTKLLQ